MQDPLVAGAVQFPQSFDGRFFFTNFSDEDFTTVWNKVPYTFPANKTSPLIIPTETMEGLQSVRKIFAERLAEREYYKSQDFKKLEGNIKVGEGSSLHSALSYAPLVKNRQNGEWDVNSPLASYALKCLEPLPVEHAKVGKVETKEFQTRGSKVLNARATDAGDVEGDSLVGGGQVVA